MRKKVAIQGIDGAFHGIAAEKYFGKNLDILECMSFRELCEAVKTGTADFGIMAIENTLAGSILPNYALLEEYNFRVTGEVYLHIRMHLVALPGVQLPDIRIIQSHPMAIRQCADYLWGFRGVQILERDDTAACAREISEKKLRDTAALASQEAAEKYGLEILERRVETNKQNFTRFLILERRLRNDRTNNKASLSFRLGHHPGSLADVLILFRDHNINLTKIQSVPIIGKPYEYSFHADLEWSSYEQYEKAMQAILKTADHVTILGEYKKAGFAANN